MRGMRPALGSERRWRDIRLQATNTALTVKDIETDQDVPPYIWYPLCNLLSTALTPALRDPSKVYIEYLAIKAEMRLVSSVLHRSIVASGPLDALAAAFRTPASCDTFTLATITFTPGDRDSEMAEGVQTVPTPPAATLLIRCSDCHHSPHSISQVLRGFTLWGVQPSVPPWGQMPTPSTIPER